MSKELIKEVEIKIAEWIDIYKEIDAINEIPEYLAEYQDKFQEYQNYMKQIEQAPKAETISEEEDSGKPPVAWTNAIKKAMLPAEVKDLLYELADSLENKSLDFEGYINTVIVYHYNLNVVKREKEMASLSKEQQGLENLAIQHVKQAIWYSIKKDIRSKRLNASPQSISEVIQAIHNKQTLEFSVEEQEWSEAKVEAAITIEATVIPLEDGNFGGVKVVKPINFNEKWSESLEGLKAIGSPKLKVSVKGAYDSNVFAKYSFKDNNAQLIRASMSLKAGKIIGGGNTLLSMDKLVNICKPWMVASLKLDIAKLSGETNFSRKNPKGDANLNLVTVHIIFQIKGVELYKQVFNLKKTAITDITLDVRLSFDVDKKLIESAAKKRPKLRKFKEKTPKEIEQLSDAERKKYNKQLNSSKETEKVKEIQELLKENEKDIKDLSKKRKQQNKLKNKQKKKFVQDVKDKILELDKEIQEVTKKIKKNGDKIRNLTKGIKNFGKKALVFLARNKAAIRALRILRVGFPAINAVLLVVDIVQVGIWIYRNTAKISEEDIKGRLRELFDVMDKYRLSRPTANMLTIAMLNNLTNHVDSFTEYEFELLLENFKTREFKTIRGIFSLKSFKGKLSKLAEFDIELTEVIKGIDREINLQKLEDVRVSETNFIEGSSITLEDIEDESYLDKQYLVQKEIIKTDSEGNKIAGPFMVEDPSLFYTVNEIVQKEPDVIVRISMATTKPIPIKGVSESGVVFRETRYFNVNQKIFCEKP